MGTILFQLSSTGIRLPHHQGREHGNSRQAWHWSRSWGFTSWSAEGKYREITWNGVESFETTKLCPLMYFLTNCAPRHPPQTATSWRASIQTCEPLGNVSFNHHTINQSIINQSIHIYITFPSSYQMRMVFSSFRPHRFVPKIKCGEMCHQFYSISQNL